MAPVLAALLWRRHRRARFSAYVFFSVLAARGALTGVWALPVYALAVVGVLQTASARAAWPRLTPAWRARGDAPARGDRMRGRNPARLKQATLGARRARGPPDHG